MGKNNNTIVLILALLFLACSVQGAKIIKIEDIKAGESDRSASVVIVLSSEKALYEYSVSNKPCGVLVEIGDVQVEDTTVSIGERILKDIKVSQISTVKMGYGSDELAIRPVLVAQVFIGLTDVPSHVSLSKKGNSIIVSIAMKAQFESRSGSVPAKDTKVKEPKEKLKAQVNEETKVAAVQAEKLKQTLEQAGKEKQARLKAEATIAKLEAEITKRKAKEEELKKSQEEAEKKKIEAEAEKEKLKAQADEETKLAAVQAEKLKQTLEQVGKEKQARLKAEATIAKLEAELTKRKAKEEELKKSQEEAEKKKIEAEADTEKNTKATAEAVISKLDARIAKLVKSHIASQKPGNIFTGETMTRLPVKTDVNIFFELGKDNLSPTACKTLDKIVGIMNTFVENKIRVEGYTDSTGSKEFNSKLSIRRAESVAEYLIKKGVARKRISIKGYSFVKPIVSNSTEISKAQNRRVKIIIMDGEL